MSKALHSSELNYTIMEKQAYALVKTLKHFRVYVGYSKIVGYVPHSTVKDILAQQDCLGVRGKWFSKIQEYDLEIKPTKLVKGQGLAQMLAKGNERALDLVFINGSIFPRFFLEDPFSLSLVWKTHLQPMDFFPSSKLTNFQLLFSCNDANSASIASLHSLLSLASLTMFSASGELTISHIKEKFTEFASLCFFFSTIQAGSPWYFVLFLLLFFFFWFFLH
jgi:hypothetical protein